MQNNECLQQALETLEKNPELVARLEAAPDLQSTQKLLEEAGIELSVGDLIEYHLNKSTTALAESELEAVAGGATVCLIISCWNTEAKPTDKPKPTTAKG